VLLRSLLRRIDNANQETSCRTRSWSSHQRWYWVKTIRTFTHTAGLKSPAMPCVPEIFHPLAQGGALSGAFAFFPEGALTPPSPRSLSRSPTLGATEGRRLPDAVLHGKRSCRPRSRAVRALSSPEVSSEASQPAWTGVCGAGPRTGSRHACEWDPRLDHMPWDGPRGWRGVGPG
jgi:hypothetical protein